MARETFDSAKAAGHTAGFQQFLQQIDTPEVAFPDRTEAEVVAEWADECAREFATECDQEGDLEVISGFVEGYLSGYQYASASC